MKIFYICDRTKCENCFKLCSHTQNIEHAKSFDMLNGADLCEEKHYWEKEQTVQEKLKDVVDWVNESPSRTLRIEMAPTGFILDAKLEVNYK